MRCFWFFQGNVDSSQAKLARAGSF